MTISLPTLNPTQAAVYGQTLTQLQQTLNAGAPQFQADAFMERVETLRDGLLEQGVESTDFSRLFSRFCDLYGDRELTAQSAQDLVARLPEGVPSLIPGYEELEPIGYGGFSRVYRGLETATGRLVALKVAARNQNANAAAKAVTPQQVQAAFDNEWTILSRFPDSERIVRAYGSGQTDRGKPYLVLEWLSRGSLSDYIMGLNAGRHPFDLDRILTMSLEAAAGIAELHLADIVHNDIKAGNFLIGADGRVKLADCSMAVSMDDARKNVGKRLYRGTPGFIPVQTSESKRKDVFALGATLFSLLTGKRTFNPTNPLATLMYTPPPPSTVRPERNIPERFDKVILKAIHRDAGKRYPSAVEMAEDLESITRRKPRKRSS